MISRIISFISAHQLIIPRDLIIAAVSGGLDSTVMLHCLKQIQAALDFELEAVHVNHGIRGEAADADQKFVEDMCCNLKIKLTVFQLRGLDRATNEENLRSARYAQYEVLMKNNPTSKLAMAHSLDDQIETFFMRLVKGSKLRGLAGIPVKRDRFIRPLLFLKRSEIINYARKHQITFQTDATNFDLQKTRNLIRHQLLPVMVKIFDQQFYAGFVSTLEDIYRSHTLIHQYVQVVFHSLCLERESGFALKLKEFNELNEKLKHLLLEYCVSMFYPLNFGIPSGHFLQFDFFAKNASVGRSFYFANNLRIYKNRDTLFFTNQDDSEKSELELYPGQIVYTGRNKISIREVNKSQIEFSVNRREEFICGDKLKFPLLVRNWRKGDYFYPLGLKEKQKLSDYFINHKVDRALKNEIPILLNQSEIVWVVGLRLDERYRVKRSCKKFYQLRLDEK